ncbi:MAG TPA: FAD-dependent monooxygenase [Clostridiales bacterium]|nr:FAD-dependent monooxygenase [Clostridiales bacterium]
MGAGLSGCTLGYLLRKQGFSVLLLERKDAKKKDKLCGGILTRKSVRLLKEIYGEEAIGTLPLSDNYTVSSTNQGNRITLADSKVKTIPRKVLDDFVLEKYLSAGGVLLDKVTFSSLDPVGHRITVAGQTYAYDVLVGADGVLSAVRKTVTGTQQPTNLALEIQVPEQSDQMIIAFQSDLTGYYYQIPNVQGTIYGIGDVSGGSEKAKEKLKTFYGKGPLPKVRGAYLPTGNAVLLHAPHDIYFVGDAAGLIFPLPAKAFTAHCVPRRRSAPPAPPSSMNLPCCVPGRPCLNTKWYSASFTLFRFETLCSALTFGFRRSTSW